MSKKVCIIKPHTTTSAKLLYADKKIAYDGNAAATYFAYPREGVDQNARGQENIGLVIFCLFT